MKNIFAHLSGDGSKWGVSDFYPEHERAIRKALTLKGDWTTGWWGSKKEIVSGLINKVDSDLIVKVSVSDDFDTEGTATLRLAKPWTFNRLIVALDRAHSEAEQDRKANRPYRGFSIQLDGRWIETFIADAGMGYDTPPGDDYSQWGFQHEDNGTITKAERTALKKAIYNNLYAEDGTTFNVGRFTVKIWD